MEEKQNRKNRMKDLSFADSWKQNTVELAAVGAIVLGAANLAMKGNFDDVNRYGKVALKQAGKGFDRYLDKRLAPGGKLLKNVGKKLPGKLKKYDTPPTPSSGELLTKIEQASKNIDEEQLSAEAAKRFGEMRDRALVDGRIKKPEDFRMNGEKLKEQIRTEKIEQAVNGQGEKSKKKDQFKPGGWKENFVASSVTGLGLGAGVTAFHALDRVVSGEDNTKKKNDTFEAAGSFLPRKDDKRMKKTAGTREIYEGLADLAKRTPQAVATGIGYTGVSLGTAKMLNDQKKQKEQEENAGSRIIIELGNEAPDNKDNMGHSTMGGVGLAPRLAFQKEEGLSKLAGLAQLKNFAKNVGGRSGEVRGLNQRINEETINYRDEAADQLKGMDIQQEIKKRYGHLVNNEADLSKDYYGRELLDSKAKELKRVDQTKVDGIKDEVARDRLIAGAGLGTAGVSLGLLGSLKPNKEDNTNGR